MRCHYCDEDADITVETDAIRVGLCERHFRDRLAELAEEDLLALKDDLDVE